MSKAREFRLVVAALIATVTFAAAFTLLAITRATEALQF
jgi:hypothetical protein